MDLYTINIKKYKVSFFQTQVINVIAVIGSYLLVQNDLYILSGLVTGQNLTNPILIAMVLLAVVHSQYQKNRLKKLHAISDFDARVEEYETFYKIRMLWYLFSCIISCFLAVLTNRNVFLFFACFDILISLPFYPGLRLFKRELKNDEIMLY